MNARLGTSVAVEPPEIKYDDIHKIDKEDPEAGSSAQSSEMKFADNP